MDRVVERGMELTDHNMYFNNLSLNYIVIEISHKFS